MNDSAALRVAIDIETLYRRFYIYRNAQRSADVVEIVPIDLHMFVIIS